MVSLWFKDYVLNCIRVQLHGPPRKHQAELQQAAGRGTEDIGGEPLLSVWDEAQLQPRYP